MREGSSIAATKASAVSWPTPGMVISRRQAAEALVIRLISASIAATARHHSGARSTQTAHGGGEASDPLACSKSLVDEGCGERAGQSDPEHDRQASNLVFQGHALANQLLARDDQRAERMSLQRLHMHGLEEAGASQMRQTSRVVAISLVSCKRLERLVGLPGLPPTSRRRYFSMACLPNCPAGPPGWTKFRSLSGLDPFAHRLAR